LILSIAFDAFDEVPMITGLGHVSIVVPSLDAAARRLKDVYGLEVGAAKVNEQQGVRLAYVELPNARIELMEPSRPDSPVSKFLERNPGGGIHHFCLEVDDVAAMSAGLSEKGARVLGEGKEQRNTHGERIAFVHPRDFLGALVELEESRQPPAARSSP
jgi:methylmalonyl-CoA/ethylmalonyl-CoA epimerase